MDQLPKFIEQVKNMETDPYAERVVRIMLASVADKEKPWPIWVVKRLAETLIECRREEIRDELRRS